MVASPEGMWLYALNKNRENLNIHISAGEMQDQQREEIFRNLLLQLR